MPNEPEMDCSYRESCPLFKYFRVSAKKSYLRMYCQGDYAACERYLLRQQGKPVPENMLPHGGTLYDVQLTP